jgi:ElaB/YqjD/DUF883 family membrane-anchored ribosome-binding protein
MSESAGTKLLDDLQAVVREAEGLFMEDEDLQGARDALTAARDYVKKHPLQSVAIAIGAGLLIGVLLRRRD